MRKFEYPFPPSNAIKKFGEIVADSHFVADGVLILETDERFACSFEVAYQQNGAIVCVVYLSSDTAPDTFTSDKFEKEIFARKAKSLEGVDRYFEHNITVFELRAVNIHYEGISKIRTISFFAARYQSVAANSPEPNQLAFSLVNFPLPYWYSSQASQYADEPLKRYLPIETNSSVIGKIFYLHELKDRNYPLEPVSCLRLQKDDLPNGWEIEQLADAICILFSVAVGYEVKFITWEIPNETADLPPFRKVWFSKKVKERNFYGFAFAGFPRSREEYKTIQEYLTATLNSLTNRPFNLVSEYIRLLTLYIDFATTDSISHTMQGRLLTTLAEELYTVWERVENISEPISRLAWKPEKGNLIKLAQEMVTLKGNDIFQLRPNETKEAYQQRLKLLDERITSLIHYQINHEESFIGRLTYLFEYHQYKVSPDSINGFFKNIRAFVDSRNSLVHVGCLAHEKQNSSLKLITFCSHKDHNLEHEMQNVLQMVPLMFAVILKYSGRYCTVISNTREEWQYGLIWRDFNKYKKSIINFILYCNGKSIDKTSSSELLRPYNTYYGKQSFDFFDKMATESPVAQELYMYFLMISLGVHMRTRKYERHETAIYIISGEAEVWYGDQLEQHTVTRAGDLFYIPAGVPHLPMNTSSEPCTAVIARTDPNEQESVVLLPELDALFEQAQLKK